MPEKLLTVDDAGSGLDADKLDGQEGAYYRDAGTAPYAHISSAIARIASPAFSGQPTAPTPEINDNTTKIATTAFVRNNRYAIGSIVIQFPQLSGLPETIPSPASTYGGTMYSPADFSVRREAAPQVLARCKRTRLEI